MRIFCHYSQEKLFIIQGFPQIFYPKSPNIFISSSCNTSVWSKCGDGMNKYIKIVLSGIILWLIPFIAGFPFVDAKGNFLIPETFFKTIMIVVGSLVGVILAVRYFKAVKEDFVSEGVLIGVSWLFINLAIDIVLVFTGFFPMTVAQYFTDIGLRYLCIPIYTIGLGYALKQKP